MVSMWCREPQRTVTRPKLAAVTLLPSQSRRDEERESLLESGRPERVRVQSKLQ